MGGLLPYVWNSAEHNGHGLTDRPAILFQLILNRQNRKCFLVYSWILTHRKAWSTSRGYTFEGRHFNHYLRPLCRLETASLALISCGTWVQRIKAKTIKLSSDFKMPNVNVFVRSVRPKMGNSLNQWNPRNPINMRNQLPHYRNPVQLCEIHYIKVKIHLKTSNDNH